jgi:hypothetical protein
MDEMVREICAAIQAGSANNTQLKAGANPTITIYTTPAL